MKVLCPIHNTELAPNRTRYGIRYACRDEGCTVVWWKTDTPSTPANYDTRQARQLAHEWFDKWWRAARIKRQTAYEMLAKHLDKPIGQTHIGLFDILTCNKVIGFVTEAILEATK